MLPAQPLDAAGQQRREPGPGRLGDPAAVLVILPAARIDDLMVSYAADGGIGGTARRSLRRVPAAGAGAAALAGEPRSATARVDPDAAIKVLRSFVPEDEWLLEPGDMLYLPPGVAHHGVAEGPCFTYSIGFLAPSHAELYRSFFSYLGALLGANVGSGGAIYQDPDLTSAAATPLEIGDAMVARDGGGRRRRALGAPPTSPISWAAS